MFHITCTPKSVLSASLLIVVFSILFTGCKSQKSDITGLPRPRGVDGYVQGILAYQRGDKDAAIDALKDATEENPELINARVLLGDLYRNDGDYRAALEQYEAVIILDPYEAANHTRLGIAYQFLDRLREAESAYLRSLELSPDGVEANMNLGLVYLALGRTEEAARYTRRATEIASDNPVAWANYGVVLDATGQPAQAERALLKALELAPQNPATMMNLATALLSQKRAGDAAAVLEKLVATSDTAPVRKRLADSYALSGRLNDALTQYDLALERDPKLTSAHNDAGRVLILQYRQGLELDEALRQKAVQHWRASLAINPNQPRIKTFVSEWENPR